MVLWSRSVLGRHKVPWKVPPRFRQQGCTKLGQVLWCFWPSGADGSAKSSTKIVAVSPLLQHRSVLGCQKLPCLKALWNVQPGFNFAKIVWQIRFGEPKGSVEGSPITSLNLSPSSATLFCIFLNSFRFGLQP